MSLTASDMTPADIAAVTGNNNGSFFGGNDGYLFILFLFFAMFGWGNGFGGGYGGGGGAVPFMIGTNDVQRGFDQSAVINS